MERIIKSCEADMHVKEDGSFQAYGAIFNNIDQSNDRILAGAFADTLAADGIPKLCNAHDWSMTTGRLTKAVEDNRGLYIEGAFNLAMPTGQDIYAAVKAGDMKGMSVGGYVSSSDAERGADGVRNIKRWSKLLEISTTPFPCNDQATVISVKSIDGIITLRDVEDSLRANGYSQRAAQALIAKCRDLLQTEQHDNEVAAIAERLSKLV